MPPPDRPSRVPLRTLDLPAVPVSAEAFAPFGTLLLPVEDGQVFDTAEARLDLGRGTPRFYVMRLHHRPWAFTQITRHLAVTQCLATVGAAPWLLAVAPPNEPDSPDAWPDPQAIRGFTIPGGVAVALHRSTWHAGPFFAAPTQDFFNLELADTNQVDHHNCALDQCFGLRLQLVPA